MRKTLKVVTVLVISLFLSNAALANTEIMPLSELRPGMQGIGKTVLKGTKIENFNVEILSVLKNQKPGQDLILVKTSGDVIERTGGIASGMSGSPIYINGKLIGAIGYGWQMANHKIGMVTPIKSMLDIFELEKQKEREIKLPTPIKIGRREYKRIYFTHDLQGVNEEGTLLATPVTTPLLISGLRGRAKDRLLKGLDNYDLVPVNGGGLTAEKNNTTLKPGSAVAVQLVRGDINVSAIGTLTYRKGDDILAFGHPFLSKGDANYLLSSAYIHQMITSIEMPFKIGSPVELKGIVNQDRSAGISGKIGEYPTVVPLEINVIDKDLKRRDKYHMQVVQNEGLIENIAASAILQAIDSTIDRTGSGTAKVNAEIMSNKLPGDIIQIDNLYYSSNDIAATALSDFLQGLGLIINNPFQKVNLADIKFNVEIEEGAKIALIEEVKLDQEKLRPGQEVQAHIKLRPYRNNIITKDIKFKIPEDITAGKLELHVVSGQEVNLNPATPPEEERSSQNNNIKTLKELIDRYQTQKRNNELVIELKSTYSAQSDVNPNEGNEQEYSGNLLEEVRDTDYVLEGAVMKEIEVINSKN